MSIHDSTSICLTQDNDTRRIASNEARDPFTIAPGCGRRSCLTPLWKGVCGARSGRPRCDGRVFTDRAHPLSFSTSHHVTASPLNHRTQNHPAEQLILSTEYVPTSRHPSSRILTPLQLNGNNMGMGHFPLRAGCVPSSAITQVRRPHHRLRLNGGAQSQTGLAPFLSSRTARIVRFGEEMTRLLRGVRRA